MKSRPFKQVDVFSGKPYLGNPLAVVVDGAGIGAEEMQRFASWTNLSETTFLLPPIRATADYRLRIFTPVRELPFAGHPTLGSCHSWLQAGGQPQDPDFVVQECQAGLIKVKRMGNRLAFAAPKVLREGAVDSATLAKISAGLGLSASEFIHHQWVDNGPGWVAVMLRSAEQVLAIQPNYAAMDGLEVGVVGVYPAGSECQVEVRAFITAGTANSYEDPVTGSLNASLAQWLTSSGLVPHRYLAAQGTALGRAGRVYLERDESGQVWVGGESVTYIAGDVTL